MTDNVNNCEKITREDIKRFINKYIAGKPMIAGMIINPEMNKKLNASENFKPVFN
jgi:zinc protease